MFNRKTCYSLFALSGIFLLAIIVYSPCINNTFINLDDPIENSFNLNLTWNNIKLIFNPSTTNNYFGYYNPLLLCTFAFNHAVWKNHIAGYHLTSFILFLFTLLLIYVITEKLYKNKYISLMTVFLFVIHPIHIEPVAFNAARAHLLLGLSCLLSFYFFIIQIDCMNKKKIPFYLLSLFFMFLALLSHPISIFLPLIILVYICSYYKDLTFSNKLYNLLAFFLLVIGFEIFLIHSGQTRVSLLKDISVYDNIIRSINIFGKYITLLLWPDKLSMNYIGVELQFSHYHFIYSCITLCLFLTYFIYTFMKDKELYFPGAWFVIFYFPVSHIVIPIGNPPMGDRYMYLPSFGIFLTCSILSYRLFKRVEKHNLLKLLTAGLITIIILNLFMFTWQRTNLWADPVAVWDNALKNYPYSPVSLVARGQYYYNEKQYDLAMYNFTKAVTTDPNSNYIDAYFYRGMTYAVKGEYNKAIDDFTRSIELNNNSDSLYYRGITYSNIKQYDKAIEDFEKIINNPEYNNAVNLLDSARKAMEHQQKNR